MKVVILAGGKGTRLRPYTTVIPKPLMPVGDYPIVEILLRQLRRAGVSEVFLAVGYMAQMFQAFFGNGERLGLEIHYSFEEKPLGTAGPVALVLDRLSDHFAVMNGDLLTTVDFADVFRRHVESGADATICTHTRAVNIDFGVLKTSAGGILEEYIEKPTYEFDVSMGINVFRKSAVASLLTPGVPLDIPNLMLRLRSTGHTVRCHRCDGYWLDIGRPEDYQLATEMFENERQRFIGAG